MHKLFLINCSVKFVYLAHHILHRKNIRVQASEGVLALYYIAVDEVFSRELN